MKPLRARDPRVVWALAIALAIRMVLLVFAAQEPSRLQVEEDSAEYVQIARNLAAGRGFSRAVEPPYTPDVRRTPVYPALLASVFFVSGSSLVLAAAVGVGISILTVLAVARTGVLLFDGPAGARAALLLALDFTSAAYATQLLTESLFTLLLVLAVWWLVRAEGGERRAAVIAGILAGLAGLCRPIGVLFSAALLPACRWRSGGASARTLALWTLLASVSLLFTAAWTIRNYRAARVGTFTSVAATNLYFHRGAYIEAHLRGVPVEAVREEWTRELDARAARWTERERVDWMDRHGRQLVLDHPGVYARVALRGAARLLSPDAIVLPAILNVPVSAAPWRGVRTLALAQLLAVYGLAVVGAWRLLRRAPWTAAIPVAAIAYFLVIGGPEMYPRFRVPLMPFICLLAAAAGAPARSEA